MIMEKTTVDEIKQISRQLEECDISEDRLNRFIDEMDSYNEYAGRMYNELLLLWQNDSRMYGSLCEDQQFFQHTIRMNENAVAEEKKRISQVRRKLKDELDFLIGKRNENS